MTSREWLIHAGQVNMSELDDVNTYDPNFGRGLTSATQLDLDLSSAFKTVVQMLNAGTLGYYLQDAYNKIEPYQYGGSLIGMLDSEGIDYEYSHIYARTEAATGAIRISSIAGGFLTTLAELRRTDEASALYWLGEQFDGSIWNGLEIFETVLKVALVAALLAATGGTAGSSRLASLSASSKRRAPRIPSSRSCSSNCTPTRNPKSWRLLPWRSAAAIANGSRPS